MTEQDTVVIYNRILSVEDMTLAFNGTSDYIEVGGNEVQTEHLPTQINSPIISEGKWYSILNINGNVYIDGAFSSGEHIPEEEELAFDKFLEKTIKEVVEEVTGREVFVIDE